MILNPLLFRFLKKFQIFMCFIYFFASSLSYLRNELLPHDPKNGHMQLLNFRSSTSTKSGLLICGSVIFFFSERKLALILGSCASLCYFINTCNLVVVHRTSKFLYRIMKIYGIFLVTLSKVLAETIYESNFIRQHQNAFL